MMPIVYVAAPLGGDVKYNVEAVRITIRDRVIPYVKAHYADDCILLSPHLAFNGVCFDSAGELDREWGMKMCVAMVGVSDELIILGDNITEGMVEEIGEAKLRGIKISRMGMSREIAINDAPVDGTTISRLTQSLLAIEDISSRMAANLLPWGRIGLFGVMGRAAKQIVMEATAVLAGVQILEKEGGIVRGSRKEGKGE